MSKTCVYCNGHVMSGKAQLVLEGEWDGNQFRVTGTSGVACEGCSPMPSDERVLTGTDVVGLTIQP